MKLYTTLRSIPQFVNLSKTEMRREFRFYYLRSLGNWLHWVILVAISFSFPVLEWFIRDGFEEFQLSPFSTWLALLLRIGLFLVDAIFYRIFLYSLIAQYANESHG